MLTLVFLPVINFSLIALFGRLLGRLGVIYLTLINFGYLILHLVLIIFYFGFTTNFYIELGTWVQVEVLVIDWVFIFDSWSIIILLIITIISSLVHIYSFSYIQTDPHFVRFISYLSLFTFFIFILVTASNFVQLFIGWEGVGLCSYLLINFWFTRLQAGKAALKAILINRLGDCSLLIAIALIFSMFYTLDFNALILLSNFYQLEIITDLRLHEFWDNISNFSKFYIYSSRVDVICFFLIGGIIAKSAQIGLHTWLPSAIEGPTPVSALIHAATIVTAGIFLLLRVSFLIELSLITQIFIIISGLITAVLSAWTATQLYDIKKIIAYSTCSQLGYIFLASGISQYSLSFYHLINHAFFKALLFLSAGALIHLYNNEQDIRLLNNSFSRSKLIYSLILIGNIAIIGLPFLSGFYSKDLIIELVSVLPHAILNIYVFSFILIATMLTGLYSMRLSYFLFGRGFKFSTTFVPARQPFFIQIVISSLALGSIFSGFILQPLFLNFNFSYEMGIVGSFDNLNLVSGIIFNILEFEYYINLWVLIKLAPLFCNIFICFLSFRWFTSLRFEIYNTKLYQTKLFFWSPKFRVKTRIPLLVQLKRLIILIKILFVRYGQYIVQNNFYYSEFYNYILGSVLILSLTLFFKNLDKGLVEWYGPLGLNYIYRVITNITTQFFLIQFQNLLKILYITLISINLVNIMIIIFIFN